MKRYGGKFTHKERGNSLFSSYALVMIVIMSLGGLITGSAAILISSLCGLIVIPLLSPIIEHINLVPSRLDK